MAVKLPVHIRSRLLFVAVIIPANSVSNMAADKVVTVLNLLGADRDMLESNREALLELIEDYWPDKADATELEGK